MENIVFYVLGALILLLISRRFFLQMTIQQYTPVAAHERTVKTKDSILLDVRTSSERSAQHIKGSVHIPLQELTSKITSLEKYKDKEIICYCQSGSRSISAAAKLKKFGFTSANMKGGISAWNFSLLPK